MEVKSAPQIAAFTWSKSVCSKARLARDARFDGLFFTGVKTTGIFCRPICPATPPKELNVEYFPTALSAAQSGLRPCLRCRPEAAPGSPAWQGVQTTLSRAIRMIDNGEWRDQSLPEFAERLGVSDRYLRRLFQNHLGISPLKYANFRRALFAKQLLQQTNLPVAEVAYISGFGSTRRFNTVFLDLLDLNPRQLRRAHSEGRQKDASLTKLQTSELVVFLSYRPPYDWAGVRDFYRMRQIAELEVVTDTSYGRSFSHEGCKGKFTATHMPDKNGFQVELSLAEVEHTLAVIQRIRGLLDLDADSIAIASHLADSPMLAQINRDGLRLPGLWTPFEAGVRAILGQQVSVKAAHNLVSRLVAELGVPLSVYETPVGKTPVSKTSVGVSESASETDPDSRPDQPTTTPTILFPEPAAVTDSQLEFLAMPDKRRQALRLLAKYLLSNSNEVSQHQVGTGDMSYEDWLTIPGIGPWTVQYTAFRMGNPDIFLAGDLGVKNALKKIDGGSNKHGADAATVDAQSVSPWGSYATLLLWQSLSVNVE
jgi:AraC family transcriptional regulator, regulatory protein of adaptative response / DNA-3-methyladenine glycosylase II